MTQVWGRKLSHLLIVVSVIRDVLVVLSVSCFGENWVTNRWIFTNSFSSTGSDKKTSLNMKLLADPWTDFIRHKMIWNQYRQLSRYNQRRHSQCRLFPLEYSQSSSNYRLIRQLHRRIHPSENSCSPERGIRFLGPLGSLQKALRYDGDLQVHVLASLPQNEITSPKS